MLLRWRGAARVKGLLQTCGVLWMCEGCCGGAEDAAVVWMVLAENAVDVRGMLWRHVG